MSDFSWTQPICTFCWSKREPGRVPVLVTTLEEETCVDCGATTKSGIYIRVDPLTANYPTRR